MEEIINKVYRESKTFRESDALWDSDGCLRMRSRNISTRGNPTMQQKWLIFRFAINLIGDGLTCMFNQILSFNTVLHLYLITML